VGTSIEFTPTFLTAPLLERRDEGRAERHPSEDAPQPPANVDGEDGGGRQGQGGSDGDGDTSIPILRTTALAPLSPQLKRVPGNGGGSLSDPGKLDTPPSLHHTLPRNSSHGKGRPRFTHCPLAPPLLWPLVQTRARALGTKETAAVKSKGPWGRGAGGHGHRTTERCSLSLAPSLRWRGGVWQTIICRPFERRRGKA